VVFSLLMGEKVDRLLGMLLIFSIKSLVLLIRIEVIMLNDAVQTFFFLLKYNSFHQTNFFFFFSSSSFYNNTHQRT
jgi:hypothetical protein